MYLSEKFSLGKLHISFTGAGRVGAALCSELLHSGYLIDTVITRSEKSGKSLADLTGAAWSPIPDVPETTDVVFVCVPDHSLLQVLQNLHCGINTVVAHTAGSYGLEVFPSHIIKRGVFYPLQTFSEGRDIDFSEVPILLESDDEIAGRILSGVAKDISRNVTFVDTERRRFLHLAAVFACNFTNHMLTAGDKIASYAGFNSDILKPLIKETVSKALEAGPENSQTGPAVRNDTNTIEKHIEMLSSPELRNLYEAVTKSIIDYYKKK